MAKGVVFFLLKFQIVWKKVFWFRRKSIRNKQKHCVWFGHQEPKAEINEKVFGQQKNKNDKTKVFRKKSFGRNYQYRKDSECSKCLTKHKNLMLSKALKQKKNDLQREIFLVCLIQSDILKFPRCDVAIRKKKSDEYSLKIINNFSKRMAW